MSKDLYFIAKNTKRQSVSARKQFEVLYQQSQKYAAQSYFYTQQQWNFYRNQAYAEAMMPTADDMQNIKNDWNKLIPDWDGDDTFFKNIGKEEITYNDYRYGY